MNQFIFLGDSITDCDHIYDPDSLGYGYVRTIAENLSEKDTQFINLGYDGFTISALKRLWKRKGDLLNPTCMTILIGINDIGVMKNMGLDPDFALEEFQMNYEMLIENIRKLYDCPIILMEPFIFPCPQEFLTWEPEVKRMSSIIQSIAKRYHLLFLPLWNKLSRLTEEFGYSCITTDGVHLTQEGHQYIANLWLNFVKELQLF